MQLKIYHAVTPPWRASAAARRFVLPLLSLLAACGAPIAANAQVSVLTYHNDLARTGQNLNEHFLVPGNVNTGQFAKLFSQSIDGLAYAQPLYVANVAVPGNGVHNIVFVATEKNFVYAFDADSPGAAIWQDQLGAPASNEDTKAGDVGPDVGITGTPVIDPVTSTMYVVSINKAAGQISQKLHALSIVDGTEKFGGPVVIQATVPGIGDGSAGGNLTFDALKHGQRPGLLLLNGVVYISWASHGDNTPYHGWIMGYDAASLTQKFVFNATPNGLDGGFWESADAPAVDAGGNVYVVTGNGTFDVNSPGGKDYGDSFLRLSTANNAFTLTDYFTPFDQDVLNAADLDVGSGGIVLLPDQPGIHPHIMVGASKNGTLYVMDRDGMGKFTSGRNANLQTLTGVIKGAFSSPAYFNGSIYYMTSGEGTTDVMKVFRVSNGLLSTTPTSQSTVTIGYPGCTPSITANGNQNGIVWLLDPALGNPSVLRAFDASDVTQQLYNSNQVAAGSDQPGLGIKWNTPTIANGKVYVGSTGQLAVYGLLRNSLVPLNLITTSQSAVLQHGSMSGQVSLNAPAPSGGAIVNLWVSNPSLLTVPGSVNIAAGQVSATFAITALATTVSTPVTISAISGGITKSVTVNVLPSNPAGFTLDLPTPITAGSTGTGVILLNTPLATSSGFTLSSSDTNALSMPPLVTVSAGTGQVLFNVAAGIVPAQRTVSVTATSTSSGATQTAIVVVNVLAGTNFAAGLNFFSIPMDYPDVPLDTLFGYAGVKLAFWNPAILNWALTPTPPADLIRIGQGYWARFPAATTLTMAGRHADTTQNFTLPLSAGWNQIGNPFGTPVAINTLTFSSGRLTFAAAGNPEFHVINPNLYRYDTVSHVYAVVNPNQPLIPGQGYWIQAFVDTDTTVPHP